MNQGTLETSIAEKFNLPKTTADKILNHIIEQIAEQVMKGGKVSLRGLGTFKSVKRDARMGRNPQTGASIPIAAKRTTDFDPAERLRTMPLLEGDE